MEKLCKDYRGVIMGLYRGSNFQILPGVWEGKVTKRLGKGGLDPPEHRAQGTAFQNIRKMRAEVSSPKKVWHPRCPGNTPFPLFLFGVSFIKLNNSEKSTRIVTEQVAVGPGFLKHHILHILCIG